MILTEFLEARWGEAEKRVASYREIVYRLSLVLGPIDHSATGLHAANAAQLALERTADRIVADVAAKRAIKARLVGSGHGVYQGAYGLPGAAWDVLALLAQPYKNHPDFDPAWRVQ